ncbi:MAG: VWA domain-containing protein [Lachnospiraceae bacterium]|nr:VWA domain-containing protein [Lachnospiraceae bacterium]
MFCNECGTSLKEGSMFCSVCGAKVKTMDFGNDIGNQQPQNNVMTQYNTEAQQPQNIMPRYNMEVQQPNISVQQPQNNYSSMQYNTENATIQNNNSIPVAETSSNKKLIIILSVISSLILVAIVALIIIFVIPKKSKDDSTDDEYIVDSVKEQYEREEDARTTTEEAENTEAVVVDTSYNGLLNNLANLAPVTIKFVSSDVSDYPNVKAYFTVEDSSGETVMLSSPNVAIKEKISNGAEVEREIKSFEQLEGREGISIELVADKSGSMEADIGTMQTIMSQFVNALDYNTGDMVELIAFDSYVMYMCTYTQDTSLLNNGIYNMTTYGETALYDALYEAVRNAGSKEGARCVIAFTDGIDNCSVHTSDEVINLANTYAVPIFIIGTYSGDYSIYSDITSRTGGMYWDISSVSDMSTILDSIYTREKNMYCLEYVSDSSADAYSERNISCVISDDTCGSSLSTTFTATETLEKEKHESRYELIVEDISWSEANEACLRKGGHLITITSQEEMDMAVAMASEKELRFVWMGGYTSIRNDIAYGHWITGEPFEFQPWYPGEPSRTDEDGADEMYLMLWQVNDEWSWNDQRNDPVGDTGLAYFKGKTGYICEYED